MHYMAAIINSKLRDEQRSYKRIMERYEIMEEVEGKFGRVFKAKNKETGEMVAIKRLKGKTDLSLDEFLKLNNEVQILRKMNHPNIIKLKDFFLRNNKRLLVFEYMDRSLSDLMDARARKPFPESEIKKWCIQVFRGLAHMHGRGYFHRDLKPENLLVKQGTIKIAELGLAREIDSKPPHTAIAGRTLWYRAPELLIPHHTDGFYDSKVDMWAVGVIMAEMFTGRVLFPGYNKRDQISKIHKVKGNHEFPNRVDICMANLMPNASPEAIRLINSLCSWNPWDRPTATEALKHPFFWSCNIVNVPPPLPFGLMAAAGLIYTVIMFIITYVCMMKF